MKPVKVLKFGGTSVSGAMDVIIDTTLENMSNYQVWLVLSAFTGITTSLLELSKDPENQSLLERIRNVHIEQCNKISTRRRPGVIAKVLQLCNELANVIDGIKKVGEVSPRTLDLVLSFGERLSTLIFLHYAEEITTTRFKLLDARELIRTDTKHGNANVDWDKTSQAFASLQKQNHDTVFIVPGFIGSYDGSTYTTLGRGGSDLTGAIVSKELNAVCYEIWTDVDGVLTANPKEVDKAVSIPNLGIEEALELSHFGAKIIYAPTLRPLLNGYCQIYIKNSFNKDHPGTLISDKGKSSSQTHIAGISSIQNVTLLLVSGAVMTSQVGFTAKLLKAISLNIIMITQACSEHSICLAVTPEDGILAKRRIEQAFAYELKDQSLRLDALFDRSVVSIVGKGMRNYVGTSAKLFGALGKCGVNIEAIAQGSSEINISVVIKQEDRVRALNAIHDEFFDFNKTINVFLLGTGLVGGTLLEQIASAKSSLTKNLGIDIQVSGIADSKHQILKENIDLNTWRDTLRCGKLHQPYTSFVEKVIASKSKRPIFVDCTNMDGHFASYENLIANFIPVITPNKKIQSGPLRDYQNLVKATRIYNTPFLFETSVGAGLPVISTIKDLINSGDQILEIEAILSGTLSFIFNRIMAGTPFSEAVIEAKRLGFTEPDPRDDLCGMDVVRKVLILARVCGLELELNDIQSEGVLNPDNKSVDEFLSSLSNHDSHFGDLVASAKERAQHLVYKGSLNLEKQECTVGISAVDKEHPFYGLKGSDNVISIKSKRYFDNPLTIRGPGAGANVTAAGIFAEILRTV